MKKSAELNVSIMCLQVATWW